MIWYKNNSGNTVISTRVRLARNVENVAFPNALKDKKEITDKIRAAVTESNSTLAKEFKFTDLDKLSTQKKTALAEEHLISPEMIQGKGQSVLISKDKEISIMLMEEDHIRIQVIKPGFAAEEAFGIADKVDDMIEESLTYAFDEEYGYLTACPTNVGTGMRVSVMMHLPALTMTENIGRLITSISNMGIEVRGLYGEGTKAEGNIYQISNRVTLGFSEKEIIEKIDSVVKQITEAEQKLRDEINKNDPDALEDKIFRSYGILKFARSISSAESKALISDIMLGEEMKILPQTGKLTPLECMIMSAPSIISGEEKADAKERDRKRAEFLRNNI